MEIPPDIASRILDAAAEEFAGQGFAGAKVEAIAKRAGVNKAGLYYHVGNKEKLYEAVMLRLFGQVAGAVEQAAVPGLSPGAWPMASWPSAHAVRLATGCPTCSSSGGNLNSAA